MSFTPALKWLLILSIALPIIHLVLAGVETILNALGDATGALVVEYAALMVACVWILVLVGLVICTALSSLSTMDRDDG